MKRLLLVFVFAFVASLLLTACPEASGPAEVARPPKVEPEPEAKTPAVADEVEGSGESDPLAKKPEVAPVAPEKAPEASPRVGKIEDAAELLGSIDAYFSGRARSRIYVQTDKPLYKPGETIWVKSWDLGVADLKGRETEGYFYELRSPKGVVVIRKRVQPVAGLAANDFVIPEEAQGGEYKVWVRAFAGHQASRTVIVSKYEPPRIKKKLEFLRKAYGAGDTVAATLSLKRPTGEVLARQAVEGIIMLDGAELPRVRAKTDKKGNVMLRFSLPETLEKGDGLLTVMVDDGGITESISRRIPILMRKVQLAFFPEGGQLVEGLSGRLYFEAKNMLGKPADLEGRIVDDLGHAVARFATYKNGLGRVNFTPATGRSYHAVIDRPLGITEEVTLPLPEKEGCVLQTFDDLDGQLEALRVGVRCTEARTVLVVATQRERALDAARLEVRAGGQAVAYLRAEEPSLVGRQGIARVTLFDDERNPLAERLVYRHRRARLSIEITPRKKSVTPRDQVLLEVKTTTPAGEPVQAELALSVVDDTVLSFADDKTGRIFEQTFLEPELPGKIEEPRFYLDLTEKKSALALDLLMGTRGYRRFDWVPVFSPPLPTSTPTVRGLGGRAGGDRAEPREFARKAMRAVPGRRLQARPEKPAAMHVPVPPRRVQAMRAAPREEMRGLAMKRMRMIVVLDEEERPVGPPADAEMEAAEPVIAEEMAMNQAVRVKEGALAGLRADRDWAGAEKKRREPVGWAPVRIFPAPSYPLDYDGPRTDFRETVYWAPTVRTGKDGTAAVTFHVSDAVTSFRIVSEGFASGLVGHDETVIQSKLPFSMSVKLPLEVSAGDKLLLPLSLSNERDEAMNVKIETTFGVGLSLREAMGEGTVSIAAGERNSRIYPVDVSASRGKVPLRFSASSAGLSDSFVRVVTVVPRGFPQEISHSAEVNEKATFSVDLVEPLEGSMEGSLRIYPSPLSTATGGLAGLLREPHGCFEQASSANYPNVMVLAFLQANNAADPDLVARASGFLESGYRKITGYETPQKGYEWFGGAPGHEALTAYGLLEFKDMKAVYPEVDDAMVQRTAKWLLSRRDGKGGFERNSRALDSFGKASPEVTDAYIVYALTEAGIEGLETEIAAQAKVAEETDDAYLLALATATLHNIPARQKEALLAARRLAKMQESSGAWSKADHSVTRSSGMNLTIETTSLAVLALLDVRGFDSVIRRGVEWLNANRNGFGQWGATQATVLAIKASLAYAEASRKMPGPGTVQVIVNGKEVASLDYEGGQSDPLLFEGLGTYLVAGKNEITLRRSGSGKGLPFSFAATYRTLTPDSSEDVPLSFETELAKASVKLGESVRLTAHLKNTTDKGLPMVLARVGLPAGLTFQTWQLKELKDKGLIAFYETRAREVILYLRQMKPGQSLDIPLDLTAYVPGEYLGPASSAYLYYGNDAKVWVGGLAMRVDP